ncbi:CAP domain-containing protein [Streptomyces sp. WAC08241]|uniref:CAP domain-containing protein n=1 Tax=Streptomyces sp. WAC08241 TaxID=2487421 RepID=UPI000F7B2F15|nr:CAP domain-containing protein [Streptomyces sp. WAC08241]RSS44583.1 CAP domain-containing protein [Streptomyces sp. WAC08241]
MRYHVRPRPSDRRARPARTGGRHRGRDGARRPGFRTVVTVTGTAAVALTVAAGAYLASTAGGPAVGGPAAAVSPAPVTAPVPVPVPVRVEAEPEQARAQLSERRPVVVPGGGTAAARKSERFVREVVALTNAERTRAGCRPLRSDKNLRTAAQGHAADMAARGYYEHMSPEGRDAGDRMKGAGYAWSTWAENIHRGPKTPARAVADWMGSSGHRANILNCSLKDIGVGVAVTSNGPWWVQNFGVKR